MSSFFSIYISRNILIDLLMACETNSSHGALMSQIDKFKTDFALVDKYLESAIFCCNNQTLIGNIAVNLLNLLPHHKTGFLTLESMLAQLNDSSYMQDLLANKLKKCPQSDKACRMPYSQILTIFTDDRPFQLDQINNCSSWPKLSMLALKTIKTGNHTYQLYENIFHATKHSNPIRLQALGRLLASPEFDSIRMEHILHAVFSESRKNIEFSLFAFKLVSSYVQDDHMLRSVYVGIYKLWKFQIEFNSRRTGGVILTPQLSSTLKKYCEVFFQFFCLILLII
jgi:hypothetical protein